MYCQSSAWLRWRGQTAYHSGMVGYLLGNTVTENDHVARGACTENATHERLRVVEYTHIEKDGDGARFTENGGKAGHICLSKQLFL